MNPTGLFHYEVVMWALGNSTGDVFKFLSHRQSLGRIKGSVEAFIKMALHQFAVFIFNENDNSNFDQILQLAKEKDSNNKKRKKNNKKKDEVNKDKQLSITSENSNLSLMIDSSLNESPNSDNETIISTNPCNSIKNLSNSLNDCKNSHKNSPIVKDSQIKPNNEDSLLNQISLNQSGERNGVKLFNEIELEQFYSVSNDDIIISNPSENFRSNDHLSETNSTRDKLCSLRSTTSENAGSIRQFIWM